MYHILGLEGGPEADLDGARGGDDFRLGYSVRLADHRVRQTSLHNGQVEGLGVLRIRQRRYHREEGRIVEIVGEGGRSHSLADAGFRRRVVADLPHMEAVVGLKVVVHMEAGTGLRLVVHMVVVGLKAVVRMAVAGLRVRRMEVVDACEIDRMNVLGCRMIGMEDYSG